MLSEIKKINFYQKYNFKIKNIDKFKFYLIKIINEENKILININYILCSDNYLLKINKKYLYHNYYTDVITFNNSNKNKYLEGDIFISIDMIKYNASLFKNTFKQELIRVIIHGILHLCGYNDNTEYNKYLMTKMENYYINKFI